MTPSDTYSRAVALLQPPSMGWIHEANLKRQAPGTGKWLFSHQIYKEWKDSANSTLWIHGIPGSGKTILCASIIEQLQESVQAESSKTGLAYFFFSAVDQKTQTVHGLLSSLLAQLLRQIDYPWDTPNPHSIFLSTDSPTPYQDIFSMLLEALSSFNQVFLVVDALDESNTAERVQLLKLITELRQNEPTNLHLLMTSRRNVDIEHSVTALPTLMISIEPSFIERDIRAYVSTSVHKNNRLSRFQEGVQREIIEALVEKSHGMFLWAAAQLQVLSDCSSASMIRKALSSPPVELDKLYERILLEIDDFMKDVVFNALRWLCCSLEPLSMSALAEAAILRPGSSTFLSEDDRLRDSRDLLEILNNLITISKPASGSNTRETIVPIHYSLVEFLTSTRIRHSAAFHFAIDRGDTDEFLAGACLEYILHYTRSEAKQGCIDDFTSFPLLKYACEHWTNHCRRWENGRKAEPQPGRNNMSEHRIKELSLALLSDSEALSCWLSVFDPEEPTKAPFTVAQSATTALCYAVGTGSLSTVRSLLEAGADASLSNSFGRQPLHLAVKFRQTAIAGELLKLQDASALALAKAASGDIPILSAALSDHDSLIDVFLQSTDPDRVGATDVNGLPFIYNLAQKAKGSVLRQFLLFFQLSGEKMDLRDASGRTLLHHAALMGNLSAIPVFVEIGADINLGDKNEDTPLHLAIRRDQDAVTELLTELGADVTLKNSASRTPLAESWAKKSLDWANYEVDNVRSGPVNHGVQAKCHVLRKLEASSDGPDFIFRKTYDLSNAEDSAVRDITIALLRENRILQRLSHPFMISYLGFVETKQHGKNSDYVLYLEYCDIGDLETMHVKRVGSPPQALLDVDDEDLLEETEFYKLRTGSADKSEVTPMSESDIWTLMYQLFAALAYLHYGVSISGQGECRIELHWDPHLHRDIKPHNVVLKSGPNNERIAKLCDLGTSRSFVTSKYMTKPTYRGTEAYWPPEIQDLSVEERKRKWTTKGDVYGLGKTIQDLYKDFTPGEAMQNILDRSQQELPAQRWNSLDVLEEIHKHRHQLKEPFASFELLLGGKPGGFTYQAFLIISRELDTFAPFNKKRTKTQRQKLLGRLNLLLTDGAAEPFHAHSPSLHLAVLLGGKPMLDRLLAQGQNPDEPWPNSRWTALHLAAQENKEGFVRMLLEANARASVEDRSGFTPLYYASKGEHSRIEELLHRRTMVVSNMAYDNALQINGPIGTEAWARMAHLTVKDNQAKGRSIMVNHSISSESFRRLLEARVGQRRE